MMTAYIDELILTVVVCRIVTMTAPDGETKRRYLAAVCALVTILALISPVRYIADSADELAGAVRDFFTMPESAEGDESDTVRTELEQAAAVIFAYAEEQYSFDTKGAEITFYTDENGSVSDAAVFFMSGSVADCEKLRSDIIGELGIEVHVYTGDVNEDT